MSGEPNEAGPDLTNEAGPDLTDEAGPDLTIILPAYNEQERIDPALDELFAYLAGGGLGSTRWSVLVVDDGSTDGTAEVVRDRPEARTTDRSPATLDVLTIPHAGKGAAVRAGMLAAQSPLIIFTDADLATPPSQIPLLLAALRDADVALGSRVQPDGSDRRASQPPLRRLLGRLFHLLAAVWVTGPVADTQCGFKGFSRAAAHDLFSRQRLTGIVFDAEIIHLARRRGYRLAVVPVEWSDKAGSRMRVRFGAALRVFWDLLRIPLMHRGTGRAAHAGQSPAGAGARGPDR